jgi:hypothetical protein
LGTTTGDNIAAVTGGFVDAETLVCLKDLMNKLGSEGLCPPVHLNQKHLSSLIGRHAHYNVIIYSKVG